MKLINIPDEHHIVRHCKRKFLIRENGVTVGVFPEFLYLRESVPPDGSRETYLSAFYYEFFTGSEAERMAGCASALPFGVKPGAMIRLSAGAIRDEGKVQQVPLRVTHEISNKTIPSKARIDGMPALPNVQLASSICANAVVEITPS